ncbi:hypothetical protein EXIGLDRAFT_769698 [Exidia glandulosa HHB12029]|uniref:F-box domain-containing protein n=1 Tax=Exidia glandulosa HHB12029 TaxID=1314781 RepID=A0A165H9S0_EXIGL|nr:hypothetical protein EXIGLDRAFT_769698 [Exidia glandulosa HHB12029]
MSTALDSLLSLTNTAVDVSRRLPGSRRPRAIATAFSACLDSALRQRALERNAMNPFLNLPDAILARIFTDRAQPDISRICQRLKRLAHDVMEFYRIIVASPGGWMTTSEALRLLECVAMTRLDLPVQYLSIRLDDSMSRAWFEGLCHVLEAILDRVQDLSIKFPADFARYAVPLTHALKGPAPTLTNLSITQALPSRRSQASLDPSQTLTAWTFEHMLVDGAPQLAHFAVVGIDISLFQAPHQKLSNLRTLVVRSIASLNGAKDVDDLLAFLPNLEELSVSLSVRSETSLAPCAFTTVHRKLRYFRVNRPRCTAFNLLTLCAVLGCVHVLAIDSCSLVGPRPCGDIYNVLPIISSGSLGSGLCEWVAHRSLDEQSIRILCSTGFVELGWSSSLQDILDAPNLSHLTNLSFHEFFWPHRSQMHLPALPNLSRLRIMLASCRDYHDTLFEPIPHDPPLSILSSCTLQWDLPALRTMHLSHFSSSRCDKKHRPHCTCRPTMSLALSDLCSFSRAPLRWSASNCTALRLSGFDIVDVDAAKYLCALYTMFQEITITDKCEPESCDVDSGVWKGTSLSIFEDPLVIGS